MSDPSDPDSKVGQSAPQLSKRGRPIKKAGRPEGAQTMSPEAKTAYQESQLEMVKQHEVLRAKANYRQKITKVKHGPHGSDRLQGADAEQYVRRKLGELQCFAVAELEYQLLYGSDKTRSELARDILDRSGHGKSQERGVHGAVIVFQGIKGATQLPWAQEENQNFLPEPKTIDAFPSVRDLDPKANDGRVQVNRALSATEPENNPGLVTENEAKTQ